MKPEDRAKLRKLLDGAKNGPPWIRPWGESTVRALGTTDVFDDLSNLTLAIGAVNALDELLDQVDRLEWVLETLHPLIASALEADGSHRIVDGYCPDCGGGCLLGFAQPVPFVEPSPFEVRR